GSPSPLWGTAAFRRTIRWPRRAVCPYHRDALEGAAVVRLRTNLRFGRLAGVLLVAWNGSGMAAATPEAGQDLTPTARELSNRALRQYELEHFDAAIESFTGAYALSNNPGLLFNVAQAYRLKGDCEHARDYYQRYL